MVLMPATHIWRQKHFAEPSTSFHLYLTDQDWGGASGILTNVPRSKIGQKVPCGVRWRSKPDPWCRVNWTV
jgi:hypothetical protein